MAACLETAQQRYSSQDAAIDALSRTLIANTLKSQRCTSGVEDLYRALKATLAHRESEDFPPTLEEKELVSTMTNVDWIDATDYHLAVENACRTRVFFSTASKIGLGPSGMQLGDMVYIIRNTRTPFVLRPVGGKPDHFRLIGETYVHGVMCGEAFRSSGEHEFKNVYLD